MSNDNINKINAHYVPQSYLERFAAEVKGKEAYIFAYRQGEKPFKTNIRNIASKKGYYTITLKSGEKSDMVEKMLAETEGVGKNIITDIIQDGALPKDETCIGELSHFFSLLALRNPTFDKQSKEMTAGLLRETQKTMARNPVVLENELKKAGIKIDKKNLIELREKILDFDSHFKVDFGEDNSYFIRQFLELAVEIAPILYKKHWHLLQAQNDYFFVTSDNPIVQLHQKDTPPFYRSGFLAVSLLIPISPKYCILLRNKPLRNSLIKVKKEKVILLNRQIIKNADTLVFSKLLSSRIVRDFREATGNIKPKVQTKHMGWAPFIITTTNLTQPEIDLS